MLVEANILRLMIALTRVESRVKWRKRAIGTTNGTKFVVRWVKVELLVERSGIQ